MRRSEYLEFAEHGCDYCFWMIHYRNRQRQTRLAREVPIATNTELDKPDSLDTNIVCMFTNGTADCPNLIKRVKYTIEANLRQRDNQIKRDVQIIMIILIYNIRFY